jgi:hypothetical protein
MYYRVLLSICNTCLACPGLCNQCEEIDGNTVCLRCNLNSNLTSGACNQGFYLSSPSTCSAFLNGCKRCVNDSSCEECYSQYYIDSSNNNVCSACPGVWYECEKELKGNIRCFNCKSNATSP